MLKVNPILKKNSARKSLGPKLRGKENQGKQQHNLKADNEQAIIDACWSVNMLGSKVRNKMLDQINRANKIRKSQPPVRAKTPNKAGPKYKKETNRVTIVKEDKSPEQFIERNITSSIKLSPRKNIMQSSFITSMFSEFNESLDCKNEGLNSSDVTAFQTGIDSVIPSVNLTSNSSYKTLLKSQITMCTKNENKEKRKRRGRKERNKFENDQSIIDPNNVTVTIHNERILEDQSDSKLNESALTSVSNNAETVKKRTKSGVRKIATHNLKKSFISTMKQKTVITKKDINPKRYIARKYLAELYDKVIFSVKEIERTKKLAATLQHPKVGLDKRIKHNMHIIPC